MIRSLGNRIFQPWSPRRTDLPDKAAVMQISRHFLQSCYQLYVQNARVRTLHSGWAKACALFDMAMAALVQKNSGLADDVVLVTTVVYGILLKEDS